MSTPALPSYVRQVRAVAPVCARRHGRDLSGRLRRAAAAPRSSASSRRSPRIATRPGLTARLLDEAKVAVRLNHTNLVQVFDAGQVDDELYIAMELIEGRDLRAVWNRTAERRSRIPLDVALYVVREIARGLDYAHNYGGLNLVHRDIAPPNISRRGTARSRVTDFGLARSILKNEKTAPGIVYGRVAYLAPEQARGEQADARTDIFATGVILWELLTGRPLHDTSDDAVKNLEQARHPRIEPPSHLTRGLPPSIDAGGRSRRWRPSASSATAPPTSSARRSPTSWARIAPGTDASRVASFLQRSVRRRDQERGGRARAAVARGAAQAARAALGRARAAARRDRDRRERRRRAMRRRPTLAQRRHADSPTRRDATRRRQRSSRRRRRRRCRACAANGGARPLPGMRRHRRRSRASPPSPAPIRSMIRATLERRRRAHRHAPPRGAASRRPAPTRGAAAARARRAGAHARRARPTTPAPEAASSASVDRRALSRRARCSAPAAWARSTRPSTSRSARRSRSRSCTRSSRGRPTWWRASAARRARRRRSATPTSSTSPTRAPPHDGDVYFVMERLDGLDLGEVLRHERRIAPDRVGRTSARRSAARCRRRTRPASSTAISSRRTSSSSSRDGNADFVKVLDFGIAKQDMGNQNSPRRLTTPGIAMGTPEYMAPEQAAGKADRRARRHLRGRRDPVRDADRRAAARRRQRDGDPHQEGDRGADAAARAQPRRARGARAGGDALPRARSRRAAADDGRARVRAHQEHEGARLGGGGGARASSRPTT